MRTLRYNQPSPRERLRWQMLGLALGALLAVSFAPATSWIVRQHLRLSLDPIARWESWTKPQMRQRAVSMPSNDVGTLIASAILPTWEEYEQTPGEIESYRKVSSIADRLYSIQSVAPEPLACAAYLRYAACSQVQILSAENTEASESHNKELLELSANRPAYLDRFERAARQGETLETDNAFFTTMLAIAHFAGNRELEGIHDLDRAAGKPRWEDYSTGEMQALWRYQERAYGLSSAAARTQTLYSISLDYNGAIQQMARKVQELAMQQERMGNIEAGIGLRGRMMRLAALMRDQGPHYLFARTSTHLFRIVRTNPGGDNNSSAHIKSDRGWMDFTEQKNLSLDTMYVDFLTRHHLQAEAAWFRAEMGINSRQERLDWTDNQDEKTLIYYWAACLLLLSEVFVLLLLGSAAALPLFLRRFQIQTLRPLPRSVAVGVGLGVLMGVILMVLLGATFTNMERLYGLWTFGLLAVFIGLYGAMQRSRALTISMILTTLFLLTVFSLILWQDAWIRIAAEFWLSPTTAIFNNPAQDETHLMMSIIGFWLLGLPVLVALLGMLISRIRRVPVALGALSGFRAAAVPLSALLLLGYVGTVLVVQRQEAACDARLHQLILRQTIS